MPRKNKRSKAASARNVKRVATTQNTSENVANNSSRPNASVETESCDVAGYANINFIDRVRGNFHQGDEQFSQFSRGVQCSCNAPSMLCKVDSLIQKLKPCHLDEILRNGDQLYRVTAQNLDTQNELANDGYLEIHQLPTHIALVDLNYTADYEILRYGKIHEDPLYSYLESLDIGLRSAFTASEKAILVYDDSILALYHDVTSEQYLFFDSHSRDESGFATPDGRSFAITFPDIQNLEKFLKQLANKKHVKTYAILPVTITLNPFQS